MEIKHVEITSNMKMTLVYNMQGPYALIKY